MRTLLNVVCAGAFAITALHASAALAKPGVIGGEIVDRNGKPLARVIVSLSPGNVELVTDRDGKFAIDYLRNDTGERIKLAKKTSYTLSVFKPGFHTSTLKVAYKHGPLQVETVTMVEETIKVQEISENVDPGLYNRNTTSTGATYEDQ